MTLSIEDLPAPFGPMIARISCSRTSKETACSATTPPKASEMSSISRSAAPIFLPVLIGRDATGRDSRRLPRRGDAVGPRLHDSQVRRYRTGAPVLEAHLRLDEAARLARVEGIDQRGVFLADMAAAHLARARELAVVGVELLLQYEETLDLRVAERGIGGEVAVHFFHALAHQLVDRRLRGEVGVAGIGQVALLGPVGHRLHVEVDEGADPVTPVPEAHRFLDVGKELELVLDVLRREQGAVGELAHILCAVDDFQMTPDVEITAVAGVEETLRVDRLARRIRLLVVLLHDAGG